MKRRVTIAFVLLAAIAAAIVLLRDPARLGSPDPVFAGKPASQWVRQFILEGSSDARHALQEIGEPAVPYLTARLSRPDSAFNGVYVSLWPHLPSVLQSRLERPVLAQDVRMRALEILRDMKPTPSTAVGPLIDRLRDKDATIRLHAAIALGNVGPDARAAVPMLKPFLKQKHVVRVYTAHALWKIEHNAEEILPILEQGVQEEAPFRWAAAVFLGEMGPAAERAIPLLKDAAQATDKSTASCAVQALAHISPRTTPILMAMLKDPDPGMRISAAVALGRIGAPAKEAVSALTALLNDEATGAPEPVGKAAADALKHIDPITTP